MVQPSPSYTVALHLEVPASQRAVASLVDTATATGAVVTGVDVAEAGGDTLIVDLTADTRDSKHRGELVARLEEIEGVVVRNVGDSTFLAHVGGKIEVVGTYPIHNRRDLARVYTPGVARVCKAIYDHPERARMLTIKKNTVAVVTDGTAVLGMGDIGPAAAMPVMEGKAVLFKQFGNVDAWPVALDTKDPEEIIAIKKNTVAVVTDGTAVLGLGDIGPAAAMPVMEGKAVLFKQFGDVDAWPVALDTKDPEEIIAIVKAIAPAYGGINLEDIAAPKCLDTKDPEEIIAIVKAIAPAYGGINLEDIAAPKCFDIEARLREELDIPVFHDDQHGTRGRQRRGLGGHRHRQAAHGARRHGHRRLRAHRSLVRGEHRGDERAPQVAGGAHQPPPGHRIPQGGPDGGRRVHRGLLGQPPGARGPQGHERRCDRLRHGQPDPRGRPDRRRRLRRRGGHGPLGLPQPDQ